MINACLRTPKAPTGCDTLSRKKRKANGVHGLQLQRQQLLIDSSWAELTSTNLVGLDGHFQTTVYTLELHPGHQQTVRDGDRGNLGRLPATSARRTSSTTGEKHSDTNSLCGAYVQPTTQRNATPSLTLAHTCSKTRRSSSSSSRREAARGWEAVRAALRWPMASRRHRCRLFTSQSFIQRQKLHVMPITLRLAKLGIDKVRSDNAGVNFGTIFCADAYSGIYVVLRSIVAARRLCGRRATAFFRTGAVWRVAIRCWLRTALRATEPSLFAGVGRHCNGDEDELSSRISTRSCQWENGTVATIREPGRRDAVITFCVSRRRRKMYCGHARLCVCVCLSVCPRPAADPDVTWGRCRGCPLVVHYWADLQSGHGLRCYVNITRTLVTSLRPSRDMTTVRTADWAGSARAAGRWLAGDGGRSQNCAPYMGSGRG